MPKYDVVMSTIFSWDAFRAKQWIDYHSLIGVDHFYLYYHGALSDLKLMWPKDYDILMEYVERGIVTLIEWDIGYWKRYYTEQDNYPANDQGYYWTQISQINHVPAEFGEFTNWILNIPVDQFLVVRDHKNIKDFLLDMDKQGVIIATIPEILAVWGGPSWDWLTENKGGVKQFTFNGKRLPKVREIHKEPPEGLKSYHSYYTDIPFEYEYINFDLNDFEEYDTVLYDYDGRFQNYIFNVQRENDPTRLHLAGGELGIHDAKGLEQQLVTPDEARFEYTEENRNNYTIMTFHYNYKRFSYGKKTKLGIDNRIRELIRENSK
jgi:hypothetical protein